MLSLREPKVCGRHQIVGCRIALSTTDVATSTQGMIDTEVIVLTVSFYPLTIGAGSSPGFVLSTTESLTACLLCSPL